MFSSDEMLMLDLTDQSPASTHMPTTETTLERADFTLQLLMFVTAEKERGMFVISFFPVFVSCCPPGFKQ